MPRERDLCRGWKESDIRALVDQATSKQFAVLRVIAERPGTTTEGIAAELGWASHLNVRGVLSGLSALSHRLGVLDHEGKPSWPFVIREPAQGSTFWRYDMPPAVGKIVLETPQEQS